MTTIVIIYTIDIIKQTEDDKMTNFIQQILIVSIIFMGVLYVADHAIERQDIICQEGC